MNFVVLVSVITALFVRASFAEHGIRGRIFNGQNAEEYQFRFAALLLPKSTKFFGLFATVSLCGGAIIGPNWVLTAAHCVDGIKKVYVYLGVVKVNSIEVGYEVKKTHMFIHPDWDSKNILNDVALIQIPTTRACDKIRFALLPFVWMNTPQSLLVNMEIIAMGWGQTGENKPISNRLKWTKMAIIRNEKCDEYYGDITEENLCGNTTIPYGAPCMGDSGGPVILGETGHLIGIFSSRPRHGCESGNPSYFMRVTSYLPWITDITGIRK